MRNPITLLASSPTEEIKIKQRTYLDYTTHSLQQEISLLYFVLYISWPPSKITTLKAFYKIETTQFSIKL